MYSKTRKQKNRKRKVIARASDGSKLATAKQLAFIRRLGGTPSAEMTDEQARQMTSVLQRNVGWPGPVVKGSDGFPDMRMESYFDG